MQAVGKVNHNHIGVVMLNISYHSWRIAVMLAVLSLSTSASAELNIAGSDTLESYFQYALTQYARGPGAGVPVKADYKGTSSGFKALCEGRATIIPASSKLEGDALNRCVTAKIAIVELPVAFDAIAVIAHPSRNSMSELSMAELKTIFSPENTGKVTSWAQVRNGFPDAPLSVASLDVKSGTNSFFGERVHGMKGFVRSDARTSANHADIINIVAADPNAIGFVSLGALTDSKANVWKIPVNFGKGAVVPSKETVLNDRYSTLSRVLYIYVAKSALNEQDGHASTFLLWLLERGAKLATHEGFVPLIDQNYADNIKRVKAK